MADPKELAKLLEAHIIGTTEWRVANPKTGDFCMSFSRRDTMHPEAAAREWLRDHRQRFPASPFASYEVREVTYYSGLEQIALQVVDYLNSTLGVTGASALRPLTLDRIEELWEALEHKAPVYLARAVEAAHGIGVNLPDGAKR